MTIQLTEHQAKYIRPKALEWIEALKSGEYAQTSGQLATPDKTAFCCLGVAAEVCKWEYMPQSGTLSDHPYREELGLWDDEGDSKEVDGNALTYLNDRKKWTFKEIANHLLAYPDRYFSEIK